MCSLGMSAMCRTTTATAHSRYTIILCRTEPKIRTGTCASRPFQLSSRKPHNSRDSHAPHNDSNSTFRGMTAFDVSIWPEIEREPFGSPLSSVPYVTSSACPTKTERVMCHTVTLPFPKDEPITQLLSTFLFSFDCIPSTEAPSDLKAEFWC